MFEKAKGPGLPSRAGGLGRGGIRTPPTSASVVVGTPTATSGLGIAGVPGIASVISAGTPTATSGLSIVVAGSIVTTSAPATAATAGIAASSGSVVLKIRIGLELEGGTFAALGDVGLQEVGNFLVGLHERTSEDRCHVLVAVGVER